jgi:hypothetical protein
MNNIRIGTMVGNTSPSKLAPETIKIRNALIEKYADQPIEELNEFLQRALEVEKDELKRLGLLAARVYILRQKVISLKAFIRDERMNSLPTPNLALTEQILLDETANSDIDVNRETIATGEWHSLQMIEPGEVNGVRFFEGTVINAKAEDAEKLISSGKAIIIDKEGNPVGDSAADSVDNTDNSDTLDSKADVNGEAKAADTTDGGIESDDENAGNPGAVGATNSADNTDNSDTLDSKADVNGEAKAADTTDGGIESDDENAGNPGAVDATNSADNTDNSDTFDPKANVIDEAKAADENADAPNSEGATEEGAQKNNKNKSAEDPEETKA